MAGSALSLDTVLELLADQHRRYALYTLTAAATEAITLETLVEEVATLDAALDGGALTRDRYLEVAADLHHWHLPVLTEVGVVEYDERSGSIRYRNRPALESWIRRIRDGDLEGEDLPADR